MESRPDLVTGTVFKTVVGAFNAPGRVRFPCGSAILLCLLTTPALGDDGASAVRRAAQSLATAACHDAPPNVRQALRAEGRHDAQVSLCQATATSPDAARTQVQACVQSRRAALAPNLVETAVAEGNGRACAAALLVRSLATLQGLPENARAFERLALRAQLHDDLEVEWLLMDPKGNVEVLPGTRVGPTVRSTDAVPHGGNGTYVLQLVVAGTQGPEVAVEADVVVGRPGRPAAVALDGRDGMDGVPEALRLFRARNTLPSLSLDPVLSAAARRRLPALTRGPLHHVDGQGGDIVQAYLAEPGHVPAVRLAEVLSVGPTPLDAFNALLRSPAHRRQLQDPGFTHVGLAGEHQAERNEWVLVLALSRPVDGDEGAAGQAEVLSRLNAERSRRGLLPLSLEPGLDPLCARHARTLAERGGLTDVTKDGRRLSDVALKERRAGRAGVQLYRVSRPREVSPSATVLDGRYTRAGIGLHRGRGVDGLYVVVVLLGP